MICLKKIGDDPPQKKIHEKCFIGAGFKKGRFFSDDGLRVQNRWSPSAFWRGYRWGIGPDQYMNCAMFCLNDRRPFFCQAKQHCSRRMLKHHWAHVLHDTFSPFFQQCSPFSLVSCYVMGAKNCSTCLINRLQWLQPVLGILGSNQYSKTTVGSTNAKAQAMWLMLVV